MFLVRPGKAALLHLLQLPQPAAGASALPFNGPLCSWLCAHSQPAWLLSSHMPAIKTAGCPWSWMVSIAAAARPGKTPFFLGRGLVYTGARLLPPQYSHSSIWASGGGPACSVRTRKTQPWPALVSGVAPNCGDARQPSPQETQACACPVPTWTKASSSASLAGGLGRQAHRKRLQCCCGPVFYSASGKREALLWPGDPPNACPCGEHRCLSTYVAGGKLLNIDSGLWPKC